MRRPVVRTAAALGAAASLCLLPTVANGQSPGGFRVVADGLDNPRGLSFGPGGDLFVAQAGRGGSGPCVPGPEGSPVCFGTSGAVARVDPRRRRASDFVSGLPSLAPRGGARAIGPSDVAFTPRGRMYLTVGLGSDPAARRQLPPAGRFMAYLDRVSPDGRVRPLVDLGAFEAANNPDAGQPSSGIDTNPNSVDASRGVVVADAGGNDLLRIRRGDASVIAVFPYGRAPAPPVAMAPPGTQIPFQPVPTSVVRGPDGALYAGQLTGFPFPTGGANVWRIEPGSAPTVVASGFTQITDIAFDRRGRLYVLEFATASMLGPPTPGALIRVGRDGSRTDLAPGRLQTPTGLTIARGHAYVSDRGANAADGRVVRISLSNR